MLTFIMQYLETEMRFIFEKKYFFNNIQFKFKECQLPLYNENFDDYKNRLFAAQYSKKVIIFLITFSLNHLNLKKMSITSV